MSKRSRNHKTGYSVEQKNQAGKQKGCLSVWEVGNDHVLSIFSSSVKYGNWFGDQISALLREGFFALYTECLTRMSPQWHECVELNPPQKNWYSIGTLSSI